MVPAAVRQQIGLTPGTPLEVRVEDFSLRIVRALPEPKLVRKGKRLVARPSAARSDLVRVDVAKLIEDERDRWP